MGDDESAKRSEFSPPKKRSLFKTLSNNEFVAGFFPSILRCRGVALTFTNAPSTALKSPKKTKKMKRERESTDPRRGRRGD